MINNYNPVTSGGGTLSPWMDSALIHKDVASSPIASFTDGAEGMPLKECCVQIEPVQAGTGDPAPDNIRAISGFTGCQITAAGKNLIVFPDKSGTYTGRYAATWWASNYKLVAGVTYTVSCDVSSTTTDGGFYVYFGATVGSESSFAYLGYSYVQNPNPGTLQHMSFTFTPEESQVDGRPLFGIRAPLHNTPQTFTYHLNNVQLELGSTATDYSPYHGNQISVSFTDENGDPMTVYGGSLDVKTGVLTVDRVRVEFDGSNDENWSYNAWLGTAYRFHITMADALNLPDNTDANVRVIGSNVKGVSAAAATSSNAQQYSIALISDKRIYVVTDSNIANENALKTWLGSNPISIVYPLASPVTYHLTPAQVSSLLGQNNIWANTGDIALTYYADATLAYDQQRAALEALILEQ